MAKLILNPTSSTRRELALNRTVLSIGRDPSNDLVLPDAMVSRRHAVVEYRANQYFLRDCNSSNGSVVNGDRVSERSLRDGDLVAIGTARLLFREDIPDSGAKVVQHPSSPRLECPSCHGEYRKGDLFCRECGHALAPSGPPRVVCSSCGSAVPLPARFCNACGTPLTADRQRLEAPSDASTPSHPSAPAPPAGSAPPLPPIESEEPPTRPTGSAPVLDPPPADPSRGGRFQGAAPPVPRAGPAGASAPAVAPALPPAFSLARPARPVPFRAEPVRPGPMAVPAPLGARLGAALVDLVVLAAGQSLLLGPLVWYWSAREAAEVSFLPVLASVTLAVLGAGLAAAYLVGSWGLRGATPGQELFFLRVTDEAGRSPVGPGRAALRLLGCLLGAAGFGAGFLPILAGGEGLHDRIAGTRVRRDEQKAAGRSRAGRA